MRSFRFISSVAAACAVAVIASSVSAAPCRGSSRQASKYRHQSTPAVVHERVISSHPVETVFVKAPAATAEKDIVGTAVAAGSFKTLAAALTAADLVKTLQGEGPFTVFAPTDEAFAKLPAGTVENLVKPENKETLTKILLLHVVPGKVTAADVVKLKEAKTAGGETITISTDDGVKVGTAKGSAKVIKTDVKASNGIIHVIDSVILP